MFWDYFMELKGLKFCSGIFTEIVCPRLDRCSNSMEIKGRGISTTKMGPSPPKQSLKLPVAKTKVNSSDSAQRGQDVESNKSAGVIIKLHTKRIVPLGPATKAITSSKYGTQKTGKIQQESSKSKSVSVRIENVKTSPLSIAEEAELLLAMPPDEALGGASHVQVKFSHYNKHFPIHNGVLRWEQIDEEYCISFVYKGDFQRDLYLLPVATADGSIRISLTEQQCRESAVRDEKGIYFIHLQANGHYILRIEEDSLLGIGAEGLRLREGPLLASELSELHASMDTQHFKNNKFHASTVARSFRNDTRETSAFKELTKELLSIDPKDLGGDAAKDLIERRDVEDILFS